MIIFVKSTIVTNPNKIFGIVRFALIILLLSTFITTNNAFSLFQDTNEQNSKNSVEIVNGASSPNNQKFYNPSFSNITLGSTVTWINNDSNIHTIYSCNADILEESSNLFNSKILLPGQTFHHTFDKLGTFDYYCTIHPFMRGKIFVVSTDKGVYNSASIKNVTNKDNASYNMLSNNQSLDNDTNNFLNYENSTYGIKIKYPSNWIELKHKRDVVVAFASLKAALSVDISDLPDASISLDELANLIINDDRANFKGFKIIESNPAILAGLPAHKIIFAANNSKSGENYREFIFMQLFTINAGKQYIISYNISNKTNEYSYNLERIQKMIDSMEIYKVNTNYTSNIPAQSQMISMSNTTNNSSIIPSENAKIHLSSPLSQLNTQVIPKIDFLNITSPNNGQQIPVGLNNLAILGKSIDNITSDCQVDIIVNDAKSYQKATANGPGGTNDYSTWYFILSSNYAAINEGINKITAKFSCNSNPTVTAYSSINVIGTTETPEQQINSKATTNTSSNDANNPINSKATTNTSSNDANNPINSKATTNTSSNDANNPMTYEMQKLLGKLLQQSPNSTLGNILQ